MSDHEIRFLRTDEHRAAWDLFRAALHVAPGTDEEWDRAVAAHQEERGLGAFGPGLIGTARSFDSELVVPGGAKVPLAAVTGIGVSAGHTRRGVLTDLQTAQLADFTERGVVAATLRPTEGTIYGRYGYGIATYARNMLVDRHRARLRPETPSGGEVRVHDLDEAVSRWPELYTASEPGRPGVMTRSAAFWAGHENGVRRMSKLIRTAVHCGPEGDDGHLVYHVDRESGKVHVVAFHYANAEAFAGLWRFLLSVDLVDEIALLARPLDEPAALLFSDPRTVKSEGAEDETWLRLVDVPAALAARSYPPVAPVVLEVHDRALPANNGRYLVGQGTVGRTDEKPALRLETDALATLYLGTWRASALAAAGRIEVLDPAAPAAADLLFSTPESPWCGSFF
ncbi:GNAT family N-acetyltransferase [Amycolatopsis jiangsuensis]|uniref:Putative acetyltransferase n=1 Tax=Amycolatopsis jiangsuensis TaxID=1181879 RepID=A0A840INX5_9PSEU|nr:GNAT family N-acetyltransferase [Amycolatopsis jiangsuensis]MBB4683593.1 putative acetyltransferase [Amycolatopsis jiangsuensis]